MRIRANETKSFSRFRRIVLLVFCGCMPLLHAPQADATAVLSQDLKLHIPWLSIQDDLFTVDLSHSQGSNLIVDEVAGRTLPPPEGAAATANLTSLTLHVPLISYQGNLYSADLVYSPVGDTPAFTIAGVSSFASPAGRGTLVSATLLSSETRDEISAAYALIGFQASYGVSLIKVTYATIDPFGNLTQASGLMGVPIGPEKPLPLASYQHGTLMERAESLSAPGSWLTGYYDDIVTILAASGYIVAAPDYLGFGDSPGLHPYEHAKSLATATIDMLRSVRTYSAQSGIGLNGQLFLAGYSEGGYATMAVHKEIEANYPGEFVVTASAPAAGSYDLSGATLNLFLSDQPYEQPSYTAYILLAYNGIYGLSDSFSGIFSAPYDSTIPLLFDGNHTADEINQSLPSIPKEMLSPDVLNELQSPGTTVLKTVLYENDVYRWTPRAPMRLYHCTGDQLVPYENSVVAYQYFTSHGAQDVSLVPLPFGTHENCALPAHLLIKQWFDSMVQ